MLRVKRKRPAEAPAETPPPEYEPSNAGALTGRPAQRSTLPAPDLDDAGELVAAQSDARAIPANCLRVLNSPLPPEHHGCRDNCAGLMRDGTCLAEVVRRANEQGVRWRFDLERDRSSDRFWWVYVGPPVDMTPPAEPVPIPETFECPHCGRVNEQDPANFHFWCAGCGKNAQDPA